MNTSDTPRTDAQFKELFESPDFTSSAERIEAAKVFCEGLEREYVAVHTQLHRICKEGFDYNNTISLESFDDYVLRQLSDLRASLNDSREYGARMQRERDDLRIQLRDMTDQFFAARAENPNFADKCRGELVELRAEVDYQKKLRNGLELSIVEIAAENDALRAALQLGQENCDAVYDDLKRQLEAHKVSLSSCRSSRDALRAEVAELRKDKERLDWLEQHLRPGGIYRGFGAAKAYQAVFFTPHRGTDDGYPDGIRAAIDAAKETIP